MRVVLATTVTGGGGVWRHVIDLADGLRQRGCHVEIALPDEAHSLRSEAAAAGHRVCGITPRARCDVWHVHLADTYDTTAMRALMVARVVASSVVVTEHLPRTDASDPTARAEADGSPTPGSRAAKTAFKRTQYALCDRVICVSQASRRFVLDRYGVAPTKVVTVPNGVGPAPTPAALPDGPARFVAVGSVIVQKGFDLLIDAAELARVPWSIDVVGEGPHRPRLQERADSLGVPVRFVGYRDDVLAVLASATALVVSSRWEASSYVAMEAMQAGRAVVTTRIDALPEIVEDGRTGLLVEPEDPLALAGALDRMASESPLAVRMGRAGYDRVAEFGVDRMIDGVLAQYEGVCHPRHRPAVIGAA